MKTVETLNADILRITLTIQSRFPELSKYIAEMPVTIPDEKHPDINVAALEDYYESLNMLLKNYEEEQNIITTQNNKTT